MINTQEMERAAVDCRSAGFDAAAEVLDKKIHTARKLAVAYEFHRYVPESTVTEFNSRLYASTRRAPTPMEARAAAARLYGFSSMDMSRYIVEVCDELVFDAMGTYAGTPPAAVLEAVRVARGRECFDSFEVAHIAPIATKVVDPDPIVFGRIEGCSDRFFVAEWGTDISIDDLLKAGQG